MIDSGHIQYRKFRKIDFPIYQSWFSDSELNAQLGPLDKDWLDYILTDISGDQYCFTQNDEIIAVAGINYPSLEHRYYVITDIAVRPDLRRQGLGRIVLGLLLSISSNGETSVWQSHVNENNRAAIQFFAACHWSRTAQTKGSDDMIIFLFENNYPSFTKD